LEIVHFVGGGKDLDSRTENQKLRTGI
jgi:hypothetical protein